MTIEKCIIAFTNLEDEPDLYCIKVQYSNDLENLRPKIGARIRTILSNWEIKDDDNSFIFYLESDIAFVGFTKDIIDWDLVEVIEVS